MVPQAKAVAGAEFAGGWGRQPEMADRQSDKQLRLMGKDLGLGAPSYRL